MKIIACICAAALTGLATPSTAQTPVNTASYAVGPQYDTSHVYVPPADYDAFMRSFVATFGGTLSPQSVLQVTPTASSTKSQLAFTPSGNVSAFGFLTPIPYPFGAERNGYLVTDMDAAVAAAMRNGAQRLITIFPDPVGKDVVMLWPGGVAMQFYWHTQKPSYAALAMVPDNRIYLSPEAADGFIRSWIGFSQGKVVADQSGLDAGEIGQAGGRYRKVRIASGYGNMVVSVFDAPLPWPYGRETTGYAVKDLTATLARAKASGAKVVVPVHAVGGRGSAMVRFPGGYIAEIHEAAAS